MNLNDVRLIRLNTNEDPRGKLTAIEGNNDVSFEIKRIFYISDVTEGVVRGGHAHRETEQLALAVSGTVRILVSDGTDSRQVILDDPSTGLLLPRMTWTSLTDFSQGAVCLVLASTHYDRSRSLRDWDSYLEARKLPKIAEFTGGPVLYK